MVTQSKDFLGWDEFSNFLPLVVPFPCDGSCYCFWACLLIGRACPVCRIWFDRVRANHHQILNTGQARPIRRQWMSQGNGMTDTQAPACMSSIGPGQKLIIQRGNRWLNLHASNVPIPNISSSRLCSLLCCSTIYTFSLWYQSVKCVLWLCYN